MQARDDRLVTDTRRLGPQIRLIDTRPETPEDQRSRVVTQDEAYRLRLDTGLDLLMVAPDAKPPVVKLLDYGKFAYEESKRQKEIARKQREQNRELKEFYFGLNIGPHDYDVKVRHIREAMDKNHDIKIGVKNNRETRMCLKRYQTLSDASREEGFVLKRVIADLGDAIQPTRIVASDRSVYASIKKVVA